MAMAPYGSPTGTDISYALGMDESQYSDLQLHFLRRLNRLLDLREHKAYQVNAEGLGLLDRAIFSTYRDFVDK